jgi:hypothetical protein
MFSTSIVARSTHEACRILSAKLCRSFACLSETFLALQRTLVEV